MRYKQRIFYFLNVQGRNADVHKARISYSTILTMYLTSDLSQLVRSSYVRNAYITMYVVVGLIGKKSTHTVLTWQVKFYISFIKTFINMLYVLDTNVHVTYILLYHYYVRGGIACC